MNRARAAILTMALTSLAVGCSGPSTGSGTGGSASVSVDGETYEVRDVTLWIEQGEYSWFAIEGEPAVNPQEDCIPGLGGGLSLYGDLPPSVREPADLAGKRLRIEFTGDGDEANFCFVGMEGLAGAEDAWVTIDSVAGDRITFSMTGTFGIYDQKGEGSIRTASASGTAVVRRES